MTTPTPSSDPFASPAGGATPPPPGAEFAGAQAHMPPTYAPITIPQDNSLSKVALWATVLTGLTTLFVVISAFTSPSYVEKTKEALANPEDAGVFDTTNFVDLASYPVWIASYVLLALWMSKVRGAMVARGERVGGPPAVEWWGWFIPLASYVLPFLGMRAITKTKAALGLVVGWWVAYCLYGIVYGVGTLVVTFQAIDLTTGEYTNIDAYDALVPVMWASALSLLVAWIFLAMTIRTTTAAEKVS